MTHPNLELYFTDENNNQIWRIPTFGYIVKVLPVPKDSSVFSPSLPPKNKSVGKETWFDQPIQKDLQVLSRHLLPKLEAQKDCFESSNTQKQKISHHLFKVLNKWKLQKRGGFHDFSPLFAIPTVADTHHPSHFDRNTFLFTLPIQDPMYQTGKRLIRECLI